MTIHDREADIGKIETLRRERKQPFALGGQGVSHRLCPSMNGPLFILIAAADSRSFNSAKSLASGTGTQWLRRK